MLKLQTKSWSVLSTLWSCRDPKLLDKRKGMKGKSVDGEKKRTRRDENAKEQQLGR